MRAISFHLAGAVLTALVGVAFVFVRVLADFATSWCTGPEPTPGEVWGARIGLAVAAAVWVFVPGLFATIGRAHGRHGMPWIVVTVATGVMAFGSALTFTPSPFCVF